MKKYLIIITILFATFSTKAQKSCIVKSGKAFFYEVTSGVNNTTISTNGNEVTDKISENLTLSIYLVTSCAQTPQVSYGTFGMQKMKLEFIKISSYSDEVGYDMNGKIKVIKIAKGSFLWKANWPLKSNIKNIEKAKIFITGIIGGKKFNYTISQVQRLHPLPMY